LLRNAIRISPIIGFVYAVQRTATEPFAKLRLVSENARTFHTQP